MMEEKESNVNNKEVNTSSLIILFKVIFIFKVVGFISKNGRIHRIIIAVSLQMLCNNHLHE